MQTAVLEARESLFERCWWLYAACREHLFTDHTDEIARALRPLLSRVGRHRLLEVGCGPGFYSRRLAALFPDLCVTGIDLSEPLLSRAREQARRSHLNNCHFLKADALTLSDFPQHVDAVIASRLFLILANRNRALAAIFHALRPGGVCFIAEPRSQLRAMLPLRMMQMVAHASGSRANLVVPIPCEVLCEEQFQSFLASQPWKNVRSWRDRGYQFAVCEKTA